MGRDLSTRKEEVLDRFYELLALSASKNAGRDEWLQFGDLLGELMEDMTPRERLIFYWKHGLDRAGMVIDGYLWAEKKAKEKHHETP